MNKLLIFFLALFFTLNTQGQVAINSDGSPADGSAMLDLKSTTKGFLIPRMTKDQMDAINSPADGLLVFVTDQDEPYFYTAGEGWRPFAPIANKSNTIPVQTGNSETIDGVVYSTLRIEDSNWFREDLRLDSPLNSWEELDRLVKSQNADPLCPSGWHLADSQEISNLSIFLGGRNELKNLMNIDTGNQIPARCVK